MIDMLGAYGYVVEASSVISLVEFHVAFFSIMLKFGLFEKHT